MGVAGLLVIAYTFAGFAVYWLRTQSTTVLTGTLSDLGALVWFGPLVIGGLVTVVFGDRGPLR